MKVMEFPLKLSVVLLNFCLASDDTVERKTKQPEFINKLQRE